MTGWTPCGTCGGTGKVAVDPPDPVTGKRLRGVQGYGMCPTCNRTHHLRVLTISGEIPDASSLGASEREGGASVYPFQWPPGASPPDRSTGT